jgi:hypothetical protein
MKVPSQSITAAETVAREVLQEELGFEASMVSDQTLNTVVVKVLTAAFAAVPATPAPAPAVAKTQRPSPTP